jgi:hypothetical protein
VDEDVRVAAELFGPLPQREQTDARTDLVLDPDTVVNHLHGEVLCLQNEPDQAVAGARVPHHVGHRLRDDAEGGNLDRGRKTGQVLRTVDPDRETRGRHLLGELT